jgi:hypothetical protein
MATGKFLLDVPDSFFMEVLDYENKQDGMVLRRSCNNMLCGVR